MQESAGKGDNVDRERGYADSPPYFDLEAVRLATPEKSSAPRTSLYLECRPCSFAGVK
jgi:hypothetical protein